MNARRFLTASIALLTFLTASLGAAERASAKEQFFIAGLRTAFGPVWHVDPSTEAAFSMDTLLVFTLGLGSDKDWYLSPHIGYTYEDTKKSTHLLTVGIGIDYSFGLLASTGLRLRGVVGTDNDRFAAGIRPALGFDFFFGILGVEFSQQTLWIDDKPNLDVRATFSVDLLRFVGVLVLATSFVR